MLLEKIKNKFIKKADNKEMLVSSLFSMIFKIVGMVSGYAFIVLSIRYTNLQQYGVFSICLALIQCVAILARLGFDSSIVKYVSLYSSKEESMPLVRVVYLKGLFLITTAGVLFSVAIYFGAPYLAGYIFHKPILTVPFQISILAIFPSIYLYFNSGALRGIKKILYYSSLVNANFIFSIAALFVIVYFFNTDYPLEFAYGAGTLLACLLSFYWWIRHSELKGVDNAHTLKFSELLGTSLPMLSAGALYIINGWTDTLFLGMFSTQESVGIFNVLLKVAAIIHTVLFAVNSISAPQFARLNDPENRKQLENYVQKSTKLIVFTTIPVLLILLVAYVPLLNLFNVGFDPQQYLLAFIFLCAGQVVNSFFGSCSQLLIMTGHQNINRNIVLTSFVSSIMLNVLLIPVYGLTGAAFANMTGLIIRNVLFVIYANRSLQINAFYNPISDILRMKRKLQQVKGGS